jgi:hypothetical protein
MSDRHLLGEPDTPDLPTCLVMEDHALIVMPSRAITKLWKRAADGTAAKPT